MIFRPCIDIHDGKVKQIVGGSLTDKGATENFVSQQSAADIARLYREHGLSGGHAIMLNKKGTPGYEADRQQLFAALEAFPDGLQAGGGIDSLNAGTFIEKGASHVIVTSAVFRDGIINFTELESIVRAVGKERLVLDLSVKERDGRRFIVTDRWQKFTKTELCPETLEMLSAYCDEFLVHAANAEGKRAGIDTVTVGILSQSPIPSTYAGGIGSFDDIELINSIGGGRVDFTAGSAVDIFGGDMSFERLAENYKKN